MIRLKADLHTHTSDDRVDHVAYSAETLIDVVAGKGYQVLAIACHMRCAYTEALAEYALRRGVLLIPAIELLVEDKHVVVLNPSESAARAMTFAALREADRSESIVLAPHPFYPDRSCLHQRLSENIDIFDAVEYCAMYNHFVNFNRRAEKIARRYGKPMIGSSDAHTLPHCSRTFTWLDVDEVSVKGVIQAIRAGRTRIETLPRSMLDITTMFSFFVSYQVRTLCGLRGSMSACDTEFDDGHRGD